MTALWVEKYRPSSLNEIASQVNVINSLKSALVTKNIPHLIFFGPSGCGKTSTILALGKELFGDLYKERIIELNASDERGIDIVRNKIKNYAKLAIKDVENVPPWKLIILDEADSMTSDSQFALRRIIEEYSKITRFCIICNYYNKIIDPIISRCSLFRFKPIGHDFLLDKLRFICNKENLDCNDSVLESIIKICRGDLRKAINFLQKCYNIYKNNFNEEILNEISGILPIYILDNLMTSIYSKDMNRVDIIVNEIYLSGYSIVNQLLSIHNRILESKLPSQKKATIICEIANIDQNIIKGCDEYIQFMKLVYSIMIII